MIINMEPGLGPQMDQTPRAGAGVPYTNRRSQIIRHLTVRTLPTASSSGSHPMEDNDPNPAKQCALGLYVLKGVNLGEA